MQGSQPGEMSVPPGQGGLQLLLFLGQLHFQLSNLGLEVSDLLMEVARVPLQLPLHFL